MTGTDGSRRLVWFRSSYSNGAGGECVECAWTVDAMLVRDSKRENDPTITLGSDAWRVFLKGVLDSRRSAP
ncbi:DUF397 domain-containing protein [Streptomyces justiciae]|uniref:DUF397 domain-containing protein n=1 Tax=Streptomyces justiciae TaxID=2780140 RepID=A0ABU3LUJ1_9ACTN|nr:DUF397 domain-containing protein [Streptomyces justiciae]MDT7842909.1 DUF397 domain-containing protein [Streptomyces justiciae]